MPCGLSSRYHCFEEHAVSPEDGDLYVQNVGIYLQVDNSTLPLTAASTSSPPRDISHSNEPLSFIKGWEVPDYLTDRSMSRELTLLHGISYIYLCIFLSIFIKS